MSFLKDNIKDGLELIAEDLVYKNKGILAADESIGTIGKRFATIDVENTEENRRKYRELLLTTEGLEKYIGGVILFSETFDQKDSEGNSFIDILKEKNIHAGIKLDQGLENTENNEFITKGLDDLSERASKFVKKGAKFAKWRCVFRIDEMNELPSDESVLKNTQNLASFALICQINHLVPIVEPEILMEGKHDMQTCHDANKKVLSELIYQLNKNDVFLPAVIIKTNMVTDGSEYESKEENEFLTEDIADKTIESLANTLPITIKGVTFLSGGQKSSDAIDRLQEINNMLNYSPWPLTFSFGRALQENVLKEWKPNCPHEDVLKLQEELLKCAMKCSLATIPEERKKDKSFKIEIE